VEIPCARTNLAPRDGSGEKSSCLLSSVECHVAVDATLQDVLSGPRKRLMLALCLFVQEKHSVMVISPQIAKKIKRAPFGKSSCQREMAQENQNWNVT
jgi:hypothetical protein